MKQNREDLEINITDDMSGNRIRNCMSRQRTCGFRNELSLILQHYSIACLWVFLSLQQSYHQDLKQQHYARQGKLQSLKLHPSFNLIYKQNNITAP